MKTAREQVSGQRKRVEFKEPVVYEFPSIPSSEKPPVLPIAHEQASSQINAAEKTKQGYEQNKAQLTASIAELKNDVKKASDADLPQALQELMTGYQGLLSFLTLG